MVYNRAALRSLYRTSTGKADTGTQADERLNLQFNFALTHLFGDLPDVLKRSEWRFKLEPPITTGTMDLSGTDSRVLVTTTATSYFPVDGTLRGRRIELWDGTNWVQRTIRDVFLQKDANIVIDHPWHNLTDTGLPYRIYTPAYPYPADVEEISWVGITDSTGLKEVPGQTADVNMLNFRGLTGWRDTGPISSWSRGEFYQLPAPHYVLPAPTVDGVAAGTKWGFDTLGVERGAAYVGQRYGAAGTFSYRFCVVFGRYPRCDMTAKGLLRPFYISAPSAPSAQVTTTWGTGRVVLTVPDIHYLEGFGADSSARSTDRSGMELWIFRARHATQAAGAGNNAAHLQVDADGIYYLWRVVDPATTGTTIYDQGQEDPVDQQFPLDDYHGHKHIMFDRQSTTANDVVLQVIRRPPPMEYDTDVARVPPECIDAFLQLTDAYFVGKRSGEPDRESQGWARYNAALRRLYDQHGPRGPLEMGSKRGLTRGTGDHRRFLTFINM